MVDLCAFLSRNGNLREFLKFIKNSVDKDTSKWIPFKTKILFSLILFLQLNFDHLSIVDEENSEANSIIQNEDSSIPINDLSAFLHNVDVLSPLSYLQKLSKKFIRIYLCTFNLSKEI